MTKHTIIREKSVFNARNTFDRLLALGVIPIVNENDTVSTDEIEFGDNDTLSAVVAALVNADLLILMSDIDGLYTDDPNKKQMPALSNVYQRLTEPFMIWQRAQAVILVPAVW